MGATGAGFTTGLGAGFASGLGAGATVPPKAVETFSENLHYQLDRTNKFNDAKGQKYNLTLNSCNPEMLLNFGTPHYTSDGKTIDERYQLLKYLVGD